MTPYGEHTRLCLMELNLKMPEGAAFCYRCGVSLTPPDAPVQTEPLWGVYSVNGSYVNDKVDAVHATADDAVDALVSCDKNIFDAAIPYFVGRIAPDRRILAWHRLHLDRDDRTVAIVEPSYDPPSQYLNLSGYERAEAH